MSCGMGNIGSQSSSPTHVFESNQNEVLRTWRTIRTPVTGSRADSIKYYLERHGYSVGEILGEGSYSKVKLCTRYSTVDGSFMHQLACKIIDKSRASEEFVVKFLPRELQILREINHPNVVRVWDDCHYNNNVYIFMDYCDGGDLLEYVKAQGLIPEDRSRHYFRQLVSAVRYLHKMDIAHRDLKCENILMTARDQVKISDFGFSRFCHNEQGKRILSETFCGSAAYAAPEILQGTSYNPKLYDMWSIGCILFIMLTGHMPFDESNIPKMLKNQLERRLTYPPYIEENLSVSSKILIRRLLEPDVTRRGNIDHAANHEWTRHQSYRPISTGLEDSGDTRVTTTTTRSSCMQGENTSPRNGNGISTHRGRGTGDHRYQTLPLLPPIVHNNLEESEPVPSQRRAFGIPPLETRRQPNTSRQQRNSGSNGGILQGFLGYNPPSSARTNMSSRRR